MIQLKMSAQKEHLNKTISFCIFAIVVYSTISCSSTQKINSLEDKTQAWKIVKVDKSDKPSWTIYTQKIAGTNYLEYKIEGEINSSPEDCISSFKQDIYNQAADPKNKKYPTYEIVEESDDNLLTYVIHNEIFPIKNTEMSIRYQFLNSETGSTGVTWKESWDEESVPPVTRRLSRVQSFRGSWDFSPISSTHSKAINTVKFDPKKMPLWLVEPMVYKFLKKGLKDIRNMTSVDPK
jgi:hypothetical protein